MSLFKLQSAAVASVKRVIHTYGVRAMSTSSDVILLEEKGDKGIITLNRPKALNAVNLEMIQKIHKALREWENTKAAVIVKGAGGKAYCAGGDVVSLVKGPKDDAKNFFREEYTTDYLVGTLKVPYIALIDGITMGGGVGLSLPGRYRVATEKTLYAMPETAIGLFPDVGGSYFLPRLQGKLGLYLGLTGVRLRGRDVQKAGIATHFCESAKIPELEEALVKADVKQIGTILDKFSPKDDYEFSLQKKMTLINRCFSAKSVEEIIQNLKKDGSEWANETINIMSKMSPTSMKVTMKELELGSKLTLDKCLQMEYRLVCHYVDDSDFAEGVRALLIDKDNQPKWSPDTLENVTESRVNYYFGKLSDDLELKLQEKQLQGKAHL